MREFGAKSLPCRIRIASMEMPEIAGGLDDRFFGESDRYASLLSKQVTDLAIRDYQAA